MIYKCLLSRFNTQKLKNLIFQEIKRKGETILWLTDKQFNKIKIKAKGDKYDLHHQFPGKRI